MRRLFPLFCLGFLSACQPALEADYVIENGKVFIGDNTDSKPYVVAITGEEITYIGAPKDINAKHRIDASGLYVIPGFIDPHTHSLNELTHKNADLRSNKNYQFQGVTTVVNGNDGFGEPGIKAQAQAMEASGIGTNTAFFIGHGALRKSVMGGDKRPPSATELEEMKSQISKDMDAGALGLSTGLFYAPGSFSETPEIIELAKVAGHHGGIYDSHIRDEATYNIGLEAAVAEVIEISRQADIPANIAHIKALGVDVWGKSEPIIRTIENARHEGLNITADQYPWRASGTRISNALIPRWVKAGTENDYMGRLNDPEVLPRIKTETTENLRKRGGPEAVLITQDKFNWQNKTLGQIAEANNLSPVDMAIEIARKGDARIASFNMNPDDIHAFMQQPWVMTSSDGSTGHPRKYASYPKKYQDYVLKEGLMPIESFFYKSSGLVADTFNLCERGYLKTGYFADIAIIEPLGFKAMADFQNPEELSAGVVHLFVNGVPVIKNQESTNELPGRFVPRCEKENEHVE